MQLGIGASLLGFARPNAAGFSARVPQKWIPVLRSEHAQF